MLPCVSSASAAEDSMGVYVAPRVTLNIQHFRGDITENGATSYRHSLYDTSVGGGLAIGYDFSRNLDMPYRVELEYAAYGSASDNFHKDGHRTSIEFKESMQTILFNLYRDIPELSFWNITPYAGLGAGVAVLKSEYGVSNAVDNFTGSASDTKAVFAGQVGLGLSYAFTDNVSVDLGYRFLMLGDGFAHGHIDGEKYNLDTDRNFSHQVSLGLRVTF